MTEKVGEVIEASTERFLAQSYVVHEAPPLGSLVRSSDGAFDLYGITAYVRTGALEPGRKVIARGRELESTEELYREHPQLTQLLRTEFEALVVGYKASQGLFQRLPPLPARIHEFVYCCEPQEVRAFTERLDFLPLLLGAGGKVPTEALLVACLRWAGTARAGDDRHAFLLRAGKELALLLGGEPQRLNTILKGLRPEPAAGLRPEPAAGLRPEPPGADEGIRP